MKIHHLNAGTLCPMSALLVNGEGGLFERGRLVCHVLLLEADDGLVLVDTGLGTGDVEDPARLGRIWLDSCSPKLAHSETAIAQIRALGFAPHDVRHILLTHLDRDHAGGISDFPWAKAHVHGTEFGAAVRGMADDEDRYLAEQWEGRRDWALYGEFGENWFGFNGVRALGDRNADILVIPLPGHTPGHCGVAVRDGVRWLLHAGDSYYIHGEIETPPEEPPTALGWFQRHVDTDTEIREANRDRLRELKANHHDEITIMNSHDPHYYDLAKEREPAVETDTSELDRAAPPDSPSLVRQ
jgi:glyoxylase-like metal-dependent hydrolase (beta-lactamase superfamily II)